MIKKMIKKEELTEKEVDFINYADMVCKYQEAIAEEEKKMHKKLLLKEKLYFKI